MKSGKIVVIEGADGAGKATQTKLLVDRLVKDGRLVETLDFPQYENNVYGRLLRDCLDGRRGNFMELDPRIASTLYAADRFESKRKILGWLEEGKVVVTDRYTTSNMIHQGAKASDESELAELLDWIQQIEYEVFEVPRPDLVIYLDVPAEERRQMGLRAGKNDLAERHVAHQAAADQAGRLAAKTFNWVTIDCVEQGGLRSIEDIAEEVYNQVINRVLD